MGGGETGREGGREGRETGRGGGVRGVWRGETERGERLEERGGES